MKLHECVILFKAACRDFFRNVSFNIRQLFRECLCAAVTWKNTLIDTDYKYYFTHCSEIGIIKDEKLT